MLSLTVPLRLRVAPIRSRNLWDRNQKNVHVLKERMGHGMWEGSMVCTKICHSKVRIVWYVQHYEGRDMASEGPEL